MGSWPGGRVRGTVGVARLAGVLALALLALLPAAARGDDYDRWFAVEISGQHAGWMHNVQKTVGERITTSDEVRFQIGRAGAGVAISINADFVESKDGKPISIHSVMKLGAEPTVLDAAYGEKDVAVTITESGKSTHSTRPLPEGAWLTPAAANEYVRQRLAAGAQTITVRTVDPGAAMDPSSMLAPTTITHRDCRLQTIKAMGKEVKATRCITTEDAQPGVESVEFLDEQGVPIRSETSLGAFRIVATVAEEKAARALEGGVAAAGGAGGPEMMVNTFVKPDRAIENARETRIARYIVSVPDGKLAPLPSTAAQRFEPAGEHSGSLTVDADHPASATPDEVKDRALLSPSPMIDSADEKIRALAARATRDLGPEKPVRAEAMRRFVYRYITDKDLTVGFGSATETAKTRRGDCTEHAVLLAALLRADGIPSRVACGLVYADHFVGANNIFGYHMWTQALLTGNDGTPRWVDLDGTLSESIPFDATHIALAVTALADGGSQQAIMAVATSIGRLGIKVESAK